MVSPSTVSQVHWPIPASDAGAAGHTARVALLRRSAGFVDDAVLLLLVAWLWPVAILLLGLPLTLFLRFLLEIAQQL